MKHYFLACLLSLAMTSTVLMAQNQPREQPPKIVETSAAVIRSVAKTISVAGTVYARNEVQLTAGVNGRLRQVREPGSIVAAGNAVAEIDATTLKLQKREQQALLARAKVELRRQQLEYNRLKKLKASNVVSEFQMDDILARRDLAKSELEIINVRIAQIEDQINRTQSRVDFTGVVTERFHRAGEDVSRGEVLARITDIENLEVRAFVPLTHLSKTSTGTAVDVFVGAQRFAGVIRALIPTGDIRSQTFEARIDLSQDAKNLWSVGQLVSVAVPVDEVTPQLMVPRDALVLRNNGIYIFIIENQRARQVIVEVGNGEGDWIAVTGDLQSGDEVVIRGAETLSDGNTVNMVAGKTG